MTKKLVGLVTYLTLAACAHDKRFYTEDFRETIPVTSNVIDVGYNYDANGQNTEITFYDAHTGKEYRLARTMSNKRLKLEEVAADTSEDCSSPNIDGLPAAHASWQEFYDAN